MLRILVSPLLNGRPRRSVPFGESPRNNSTSPIWLRRPSREVCNRWISRSHCSTDRGVRRRLPSVLIIPAIWQSYKHSPKKFMFNLQTYLPCQLSCPTASWPTPCCSCAGSASGGDGDDCLGHATCSWRTPILPALRVCTVRRSSN